MHLNPDHYLQTGAGRVFTAERNAAAWEQLYRDLTAALSERPRRSDSSSPHRKQRDSTERSRLARTPLRTSKRVDNRFPL